jgi:hypothetical protein
MMLRDHQNNQKPHQTPVPKKGTSTHSHEIRTHHDSLTCVQPAAVQVVLPEINPVRKVTDTLNADCGQFQGFLAMDIGCPDWSVS